MPFHWRMCEVADTARALCDASGAKVDAVLPGSARVLRGRQLDAGAELAIGRGPRIGVGVWAGGEFVLWDGRNGAQLTASLER